MEPGPFAHSVSQRIVLVLIGALAALALWALGEVWSDARIPPVLLLTSFSFVLIYALIVLALSGPVEIRRALMGGLYLAVPMTALIVLASFRQVVSTDFFDDPIMLSVAAVLLLYASPFLLVRMVKSDDWLNYAALFSAAWAMHVRFLAALAFVGAFWVVLFLSNELLKLVDVAVIDAILRRDWLVFGLTGGMFGLGLAVVHELRETISPFVILRLIRLLVPVVLVVVLIFLAAAPFRDLAKLFGGFSAAATLMGTAIVSITLVSAALDKDDQTAISTRGMRLATRLLALAIPLLCALAVWAVFLRVRQYGWTPDRVLAVTVALFLLAYGVAYAGASIIPRGWKARIRQVNVVMALCVICVAAIWMTPVLNAYRISTNSQISLFLSNHSSMDRLPFWQMAHEWGRPGQVGLARLQAMNDREDYEEISLRIEEAEGHTSDYSFKRSVEVREHPARAEQIAALIGAWPKETKITGALFSAVPPYQLKQWFDGCRLSLPDGRPGCVLVFGQFSPEIAEDKQGMVLFLETETTARAQYFNISDGSMQNIQPVFEPEQGGWPQLPAKVVSNALDGTFEIRPTGHQALWIADSVLSRSN